MIPQSPSIPDPVQLDLSFGDKEEKSPALGDLSGQTFSGAVPEAMSRSPTNEDQCSLQVKEPDFMYQISRKRARALNDYSRALVLKNFQKQKDL